MSHGKSTRKVFFPVVGVMALVAIAVWQFYVFVTFRDATGAFEPQGGRAHLWWAICFGVIAFIAAFLLFSKRLQYDKTSEMHITSPASRKNLS